MNKKIALTIIAVAIIAGGLAFTRTKNAPPTDFRDAMADNADYQDFDTVIPVIEGDKGNYPAPKAVAANNSESAQNTPSSDSKISSSKIYREIIADRERVEREVMTIRALGKHESLKAWKIYVNAKAAMDGCIAQIRFALIAGPVYPDTEKMARSLKRMAIASFDFSEHIAKTLGYYGPGRRFSMNVSVVAVEDWIEELERTYEASNRKEKDKILNDISALSWKYFDDIKQAPPITDEDTPGMFYR
ncbi:MAG: hypothetical protein L6420_02275 [Elusimicrobia bacterium]|nr:hypothetical protein [Elusimicrobiota bacterium]